MNADTRIGRIWLHLRCLVHNHQMIWHVRGIARELAVLVTSRVDFATTAEATHPSMPASPHLPRSWFTNL